MVEPEVREISVPIEGGGLATIRVREKGRRAEEGVDGIVFAILHPNTGVEVGEYWTPIAPNREAPEIE
jgi:hypothetical protein